MKTIGSAATLEQLQDMIENKFFCGSRIHLIQIADKTWAVYNRQGSLLNGLGVIKKGQRFYFKMSEV